MLATGAVRPFVPPHMHARGSGASKAHLLSRHEEASGQDRCSARSSQIVTMGRVPLSPVCTFALMSCRSRLPGGLPACPLPPLQPATSGCISAALAMDAARSGGLTQASPALAQQAGDSASPGAATTAARAACSVAGCQEEGAFKCSLCKARHYCCRDHQRADWPRHKAECGVLKQQLAAAATAAGEAGADTGSSGTSTGGSGPSPKTAAPVTAGSLAGRAEAAPVPTTPTRSSAAIAATAAGLSASASPSPGTPAATGSSDTSPASKSSPGQGTSSTSSSGASTPAAAASSPAPGGKISGSPAASAAGASSGSVASPGGAGPPAGSGYPGEARHGS